ncbi:MAG TPA: hypothetical protein VE544_00855 [Nitrososphaeraceae archaeon]|nr:hypothetical protein [Nitrososphaeraceae archaeon]
MAYINYDPISINLYTNGSLKKNQIHYQELKDLLGFILDKMVARLDMYDGPFFETN